MLGRFMVIFAVVWFLVCSATLIGKPSTYDIPTYWYACYPIGFFGVGLWVLGTFNVNPFRSFWDWFTS